MGALMGVSKCIALIRLGITSVLTSTKAIVRTTISPASIVQDHSIVIMPTKTMALFVAL